MFGEILRLLAGILLSPLMLMFLLVITAILDDTPNWAKHFSDFFRLVYPVGLGGVVVFGIPCYLVLRYFGHAKYLGLAAAGFSGGALLGATATPVITSMLLYGGCGFLVATGFWLFAIFVPSRFAIRATSDDPPAKHARGAATSRPLPRGPK